jgi:hypothetical protein
MPCQHVRGEHNDEYRHCLDCGQEWVRIGEAWFVVDLWLRVSTALLSEAQS